MEAESFLPVLCWVIAWVKMKLHRVVLAGCMNCTRTYLPFSGNLHPKRLLSSVGPFSSSVDGYRALILCSARPVLYPLKYTVPLGHRKLGLNSRSYSHVVSNSLNYSQTLPESRCQIRRSQSAPVRTKNLLQGGTALPGKNDRWLVIRIRNGFFCQSKW